MHPILKSACAKQNVKDMITGKATTDIKFEQYTALLVIKSIQIDILKYAHIKIMESELWVTVVH